MINQKKFKRILSYETVGFAFLILLSWLNELISLPHLVFGTSEHASLHEATMESVALVAVWLVVVLLTKRLLGRLFYLEDFLRVCAWCRKIGYEDEWTSLEDYFDRGFGIETSHGMCPACQKKLEGKKQVAAA
jgi:hypothetical protein